MELLKFLHTCTVLNRPNLTAERTPTTVITPGLLELWSGRDLTGQCSHCSTHLTS